MASEEIGTLVARVVADNEQFRSEMLKMTRQLESNTGRMNKALSNVNRNVGSMSSVFRNASRVAGAFGVALSVTALVSFTRRVIDSAAEIQALSVRLGTSTEALSELQFVAEQSNVQFNVMSLGLQRMTRRIAEAKEGSGEAKGAIRELGLSAALLAQLPLDQQFEAIADRLASVTNESDRVRLAMKLFDSEGVALVQTMQRGATGIREMREEARKAGVTLSTEAATAAAEADGSMKKLSASTRALARDFALTLAPAITAATDAYREWLFPTRASGLEGELQAARREVALLEELIAAMPDEDRRAAGGAMFQQMREDLTAARAEVEAIIVRMQQASSAGPGPSAAAMATSVASRFSPGDLAGSASELMGPLGQRGEMRDYAALTREAIAEGERELTEIIEEQHRRRLTSAQRSASEEAQIVLDSQMQQLDFRSAVAQSVAQLAYAVFGEQKAVALAAIAFEKLQAVRRIKIAVEQAAWLAYASQIIPGDPSSLARAEAAKLRVKAQGAVSVAQTVALSVIGGLADAARVVGSDGSAGSFTNPLSVTGGASVAGSGAADVSAGHRQRVAEVHFHGDVYGWDDFVKRKLGDSLSDLFNNNDMVVIRRESRQARELVGA